MLLSVISGVVLVKGFMMRFFVSFYFVVRLTVLVICIGDAINLLFSYFFIALHFLRELNSYMSLRVFCILGRRYVGQQQIVGPDPAQNVQNLCERCHNHNVVSAPESNTNAPTDSDGRFGRKKRLDSILFSHHYRQTVETSTELRK